MTLEQRLKAAAAVEARIAEMGCTVQEFAAKAGIGETTLRAFLRGERWPLTPTRRKLTAALGWADGEIARVAIVDWTETLATVPTRALIDELTARIDRAGI